MRNLCKTLTSALAGLCLALAATAAAAPQDEMARAHMNKDEHFNALVEDLVKALDKNKVGETEKKELLGALGPMRPDIVE